MIQTRLLHWMMIAALFVLLPGSLWAADPEPDKELLISVTTIDFDECEPVLIRSKIMDAHLKKGTLVVAEREVREMDVTSGGQRIKTSYLNIEGKPEPRAAFRPGQYVLVKGFQHPDGYIAASVVQKIEKPAEKKTTYKPVAESRRASRRNSAAAQPR
jgi:hypothetical protein